MCSPHPTPNPHAEALIPNMMVFGHGALGGHEGGPYDDISALMREERPVLSPSTGRRLSVTQEVGPHQKLNLPAP